MTGRRRSCGKRRYATGTVAQAAAARLGYTAYPCLDCGGWHLTSNGQEKVRELSSPEQAVLIVARDSGAEVDECGRCIDDEGRIVAEAAAVRKLVARGMIRVEPWGEIIPRRG